MLLAAAALVTLSFTSCAPPAYYDAEGYPRYTDGYFSDAGEPYYNVVPIGPYFSTTQYYTSGYFHHGVFHPGDFRRIHHHDQVQTSN
ncbi:MAG: hypothetical protein JWO94_2899 [Verrucomicrobiaceae bacterium]|nr:hypothetical protein [Verrucomicrobiaceae bacterium]